MVLLRNGNVSGFTSGGSSSKLAQYNFFLIYKFVLYILIRGSSSARRFLLLLLLKNIYTGLPCQYKYNTAIK